MRGRLRRGAGGLALTVAFIPVGWLSSAAVFEDDAPVRSAVLGAERAKPPVDFHLGKVQAPLGPHTSLVAHVPDGRVQVYRRPRRRAGHRPLEARRLDGRELPLVLLVRRQRGRRWLKVDLPTRPNLSTGWIRAGAVRLRANPYRVRVSLARHRVSVHRGAREVLRARIGVGRSLSPTPRGRYYVTDLVKAEDPSGVYGPYSFGLSAHSPVYTTFGTGDGQIGLHGTNMPEALGTDVSSGCIRVSNRVIRRLAARLPLGTPVAIR